MSVTTNNTVVCDVCGKSKLTVEGKIWTDKGLAPESKKQGWKWLDSDRKQVCPKCAGKTKKTVKPEKKSLKAKKGKGKKLSVSKDLLRSLNLNGNFSEQE